MKIEWLLPTHESKVTNDEKIYHNVKYHCFIDEDYGKESAILHSVGSLCGRHRQLVGYYENIESGQVLQFPAIACKKCLEKWKKQFGI